MDCSRYDLRFNLLVQSCSVGKMGISESRLQWLGELNGLVKVLIDGQVTDVILDKFRLSLNLRLHQIEFDRLFNLNQIGLN